MGNKTSFQLPMPPSVNMLYNNANGLIRGRNNAVRVGRVKTPRYRAWIRAAGFELNRQSVPLISPPYRVEYGIGKPDNRKRDIGNLEKAISDLLVSQGVITEDSHINEIRIYWSADAEPSQVLCTVESLA